jgi:hypothetical protein
VTYFSKISNPKQLRVSLLQAAKEPLILLSMQKELAELRANKKRIVSELESELAGLLNSIKKLDNILPEKELKKELYESKEEKVDAIQILTRKQTVKKSDVAVSSEKQMSEMDRIEYTLRKIESKLAELDK